ncbi:MAG: TMEM43 family protein [Candidatus Magasanikbacteria bacterium]
MEQIPQSAYTKTTKTSWFSRIGGSVKGIFIGFLLFIASFILLYWNEGREDLSKTADDATPIQATEAVVESLNGTLVGASGILESTETVGDDMFLRPSAYLSVSRKVEMYAWVEKTSSQTDTKLGGSQETTTEYSYEKDWANTPTDSSSFEVPVGHTNPAKQIDDTTKTVSTASIGNFALEPASLGLVGSQGVDLSFENVTLTEEAKFAGGYIFVGRGSIESPWVGDMRISYSVVPSGQEVIVLGKQQGQKLVPFFTKDGGKIYRAFKGDLDTAVSELSSEHKTSTWIFRVIGFLMMWMGLLSIFAPLSVLLDVLPILGSISRTAVKFVTFFVSLALSIVIIIISMIFHNILAVLAVALVVAGGLGVLIKKKMKEKKSGGKPVEKVEPEVKVEEKKEE